MSTGKDRTAVMEPDDRLIPPYGGKLVQSYLYILDNQDVFEHLLQLPRIDITADDLKIIKMIAHGAMSPLEGFMDRESYAAVLGNAALPFGLPWGIPLSLPVKEQALVGVAPGTEAGLYYQNQLLATIEVEDIFLRDLTREMQVLSYRGDLLKNTLTNRDPEDKQYLLAGPVYLVVDTATQGERPDIVWPYDMRQQIRRQDWDSVTAMHDKRLWQGSDRDNLNAIISLSNALLIHAPRTDKGKDGPGSGTGNLLLDHFANRDNLLWAEAAVTRGINQARTLLQQAIVSQNYGCDNVIFLEGAAKTFDFESSQLRPQISTIILHPKADAASKTLQTGRSVSVNAGMDRRASAASNTKLIPARNREKRHIHPYASEIGDDMRRNMVGHQSAVLWMTGLSGAGKSTLAHRLECELLLSGHRVSVLDGDSLRNGLCGDLDFSRDSRRENLRRAAEVARLMATTGMLVIASFISPFQRERQMISEIIGENFIEVYIEADLKTCESRDPKGLYRRARLGEIQEFTGVSSPYEPPENPHMRVDTATQSIDECIRHLLITMANAGLLRQTKINALMTATRSAPMHGSRFHSR